jgi:hypothetical protein
LEGSVSVGWWLGGGTINVDVDTTRFGGQFSVGPAVGPSWGGRFSGSYDPSGSLDPAGFYFQTAAGAAYLLGANYSSESPMVWEDGGPRITALPPGKTTWAFGVYAGAADAILYKVPPIYLNGAGSNRQSGSSLGSGYSINQLASQVVSYANSPGANLADPNFAAALRAINVQSAPWLASQSTSVTTPAIIKRQ